MASKAVGRAGRTAVIVGSAVVVGLVSLVAVGLSVGGASSTHCSGSTSNGYCDTHISFSSPWSVVALIVGAALGAVFAVMMLRLARKVPRPPTQSSPLAH